MTLLIIHFLITPFTNSHIEAEITITSQQRLLTNLCSLKTAVNPGFPQPQTTQLLGSIPVIRKLPCFYLFHLSQKGDYNCT